MKQLTTTIVGLILVFCMTSCTQEQPTEGIYAPNNELVSSSKEDLSKTIATAISEDHEQVAIQSIDFLEVDKGFVAEIGILTSDNQATVYYISQELNSMLEIDSSVELMSTPASAKLGGGIVAFCSCGQNTLPSSGCRTSVTVNTNGTITGTCYTEGCHYGCVFHQK